MSGVSQRPKWKQIYRAERRAIGRRGVAGLAISGGGIRSATFALGVLESLKDCGLLSKVHYLSTVSGGGYIGAWLSANCRRRPDWLDTADWTASITHLRRYSNYLSPRVGFFSADTWSMLTIWLRNTLLIQATVILAIACALLLPRLLFWVFQHYPDSGRWRWFAVILFTFGIVGIAGNHWQLTAGPRRRTWRAADLLQAKAWPIGALTGGVLLGAVFAAVWWFGFDPFTVHDPRDTGAHTLFAATRRSLIALLVSALFVLGGFCLQPVLVAIVACYSKLVGKEAPPTQINYHQGYVQRIVVVPLMVVALLVAAVLWAQAAGRPGVTSLATLTEYSALVTQAWKFWPFHLSIVFVSFWLLSIFAVSSRRESRRLGIALAVPLVVVPVLHALLAAIVLVFQHFRLHLGGEWMAFVWGPALVALAFVLSIVVLIGMLGRDSTDGVREWWSRLGAWLAIYATAWMVISVSAVYGPWLVSWAFEQFTWKTFTGLAGWAATVAGGLMAGHSPSTGGSTKGVAAQAKEALARIAPFVFIAGVLLAVSHVIHLVIGVNGGTDWWRWGATTLFFVPLVLLAACVAATLLLAARVDINEFSLNAFYRNRLARCYLGATRDEAARNPQNFTGFDDKDDLPLADALTAKGPLHIVNCALNLGGSSDLTLHTRQSASFILTPLHCGSAYKSRVDQQGTVEELGFVPTKDFGHRDGGPTLGQAIAVSGAAASPNMGYHTSSVIAFLMTLFNVRLGWWFPNPARMGNGAMSPHFSLRYLGAELFGGASDRTKFLMVSDGGHFENLAAYELIRRRCRVIVVIDGECDDRYTFGGLGTLIRMAEVDFGCLIDIKIDDLRPVKDSGRDAWSRRSFAVGTITYQRGSPGILIYVKASMTGGEDTSVRQYKASHPEFPHESTGDQFYGEDQFESYRRLGREIGRKVFTSVAHQPTLVDAAAKLHASPPGVKP